MVIFNNNDIDKEEFDDRNVVVYNDDPEDEVIDSQQFSIGDDEERISESNGTSSSLPLPETVLASERVSRQAIHNRRDEDYQRTMKWAKVAWITSVLTLLFILAVTLIVTQTKNATSDIDAPNAVISKFEEITSYLVSTYNFSAELLVNDTQSSQYKAAFWMARDDRPSIPIPGSSNGVAAYDNEEYAYRYLARYVLTVLYYAMNGPTSWSTNATFLTPGEDVCSWHKTGLLGGTPVPIGLYCNEESPSLTMRLFLHYMNISGTIPSELGLLTSLQVLSMTYNNFIEGKIPTEICQLTSLALLDMSHNALTGEIPYCIGEMNNLLAIWLSNNKMEGTVPVSFSSLSKLEHIYIDDNQFNGDPSSPFQGLPALEVLIANSNQFDGDVGNMFSPTVHTKVSVIDLSQNKLTSRNGFPTELFRMPSLFLLDLSANKLTGKLPSINTENNIILYLSLYGNNITGSIPSDISNIQSLQHLDLSSNKLTGPMPSEIGNLRNLSYVFLSNNPNMKAGTIPESFERLENLQELSLRSTNRNGRLPDFISNMKDLILLDLGSNALTGPVPQSWGNNTKIQYLLLNDNPGINGSISGILSKFTVLRAGFIDGTSITDDFTVLGDSFFSAYLPGGEVLYADCGGSNPTVRCDFCQCCNGGQLEQGCSNPMLSNFDGIWEVNFKRDYFQFKNNTAYQSLYTP